MNDREVMLDTPVRDPRHDADEVLGWIRCRNCAAHQPHRTDADEPMTPMKLAGLTFFCLFLWFAMGLLVFVVMGGQPSGGVW